MKNIKCIFIDSVNQLIKDDVLVGDSLKELQKRVDGLIDVVRIDDDADLYVDDEGLLKSPTHFFRWGDKVIAGNGVVCGHNNKGDTINSPMTLEEVKRNVVFFEADPL